MTTSTALRPTTLANDSMLVQSFPDNNYGAGSSFTARSSSNSTDQKIALRIPLDTIPADAVITNAVLDLKGYSGTATSADSLQAYRYTASWDESTITWNNQPPISATLRGSTVVTSVTSTLSMNLASLVQDWVAGTFPNYGVQIVLSGTAGREWTGATSEDGTANNRPTLYVAYKRPSSAPSLGSPASAATIDRGQAQTFSWTHAHPEAVAQSAYELEYRPVGGATTAVAGSGPGQSRYFAPNTFAPGAHEWRVRTSTFEEGGTLTGAWSAWRPFTSANSPAGPTITAPANNASVTETVALAWTTSVAQSAYQVRRVADVAGAADTATVYYDSGTVASAGARSVTVATPEVRAEHLQVRVFDGLWSPWASVRVVGTGTAPSVPTIALTGGRTTSVALTNPNPGGAVPAAASNDVYRREFGDSGEGIRVATGVAPGGTFVDYRTSHRRTYQYRAVAVAASTRRSAFGAWV